MVEYLQNNIIRTVTASHAAVSDSIPDRLEISPGAGIRRNGGAEPQSLVSAPKYTWVKSQIPPQCIRCERNVLFIVVLPSDGDVKPGGFLLFDASRLNPATDFSFILPHFTFSTQTMHHNTTLAHLESSLIYTYSPTCKYTLCCSVARRNGAK
jgi:hypothetical protein